MTHHPISALRKTFLLFSYPAALYLFLRCFLHLVLGLRFGFANTTDFDYLVPAPIAFFLLVYSLEKAVPLSLRFSAKALAFNLVTVVLFLLLNVGIDRFSAFSPVGFVSAWFSLAVVIAIGSFSIFISPWALIRNPNRIAVLPCLLIGSAFYFYNNHFRWLWNGLGRTTADVLHALFSFLNLSTITTAYTAEEALKIDHALLSIRIAKGCGGGDALFYFTIAFLLASVISWNGERQGRWFLGFIVGWAWMFFLNIVRILVLFAAGIWLRGSLGHELGTDIFQKLFHLHVGWFLYSVGIFGHLKLFSAFTRWQFTLPASRPWARSGEGALGASRSIMQEILAVNQEASFSRLPAKSSAPTRRR